MEIFDERRHWPFEVPHPVVDVSRQTAAAMLAGLSLLLGRIARRLAATDARSTPVEVQLEFYAEAGAPEGALYVDGRLVGWIPGVTRL